MYRRSRKFSAKSRKRSFKILIFALAFGFIIYGGTKLLNRYSVLHGGVPKADSIATSNIDHPSEQPVSSNYTVPSGQPLAINLPSINTSGFIQKVGVDKTKQIVAPSNIYMAGWYVNSVKPGDLGLSVINGYMNGIYRKGVFDKLGNIKLGDTFIVTFGDHSHRTFQVKRIFKVNATEMSKYVFAHYTAYPRQLNLITSGGGSHFTDPKSHDGSVIVVAEGI